MRSDSYDTWTIERWRVEPRLSGLELEDAPATDQAPPLWKDLTVASILALALWIMAALIVR
jgi:hypothetical protein